MLRIVLPTALTLLLATGSAAGSVATRAPAALGPATGVSYSAPVSPAEVVRPFIAPLSAYAAGHRGVDLASREGQEVAAAGPGVVSLAGPVAGRGIVVIKHADGVSTEYEPVTASVKVGAVVAGGAVIGTVHGNHGTCSAGGCLHWGARRAGAYFDPMTLLQPLGVVRLLPLGN